MSWKEFFKPTKLKVYSWIMLIIGLLIPQLIKLLIVVYYARAYGPAKYSEFIGKLNSDIFIIFYLIFYAVWLFVIICVINKILSKKRKK